MELYRTAEYHEGPGVLTVWRATANDDGPVSWLPDPRRLSYVEEAYLNDMLGDDGADPGPPTWLGTGFDLPGKLDTDAFRTALLGWLDRHESLRSRFVFPDGADSRQIRRETLAPDKISIQRGEQRSFQSGKDLASVIAQVFDQETTPLNWPPYVFATIEQPESTSLLFGADHTVSDGYFTMLVAHEIRELYQAALHGGHAQLPEVGSYLDFAEAEREAAEQVTADHKAVRAWQNLITANGGALPNFPLSFGNRNSDGDGAAQLSLNRWLLDATETQAFDRICRANGGRLVAGIFACLAMLACRETGHEEFQTVMPFHTRNDSRLTMSAGWYVGMAPVSFQVRRHHSFQDVLINATVALDEAKSVAEVPVARVMELLGVSPKDPFMVSYMELRLTPGMPHWREWRAGTLLSDSTNPDDVYFWLFRSRDGVLLLIRHPDDPDITTAVTRYLTQTQRLIKQITETA
jgi:condensation domain-containing protein